MICGSQRALWISQYNPQSGATLKQSSSDFVGHFVWCALSAEFTSDVEREMLPFGVECDVWKVTSGG
jgi:hypothetical protein